MDRRCAQPRLQMPIQCAVTITGEFDFEYHLWATQFADVILTLPTDTDGNGLTAIDPVILVAASAAGIAAIVIVVFIAKKRG